MADSLKPIMTAPRSKFGILTASARAAMPARRAALPALKAILTVHRTVASWLKWNCCLLSTSSADHACTPWCAPLVIAPARLFVLLGLPACFAALRRRITAFAEEFLILSRKCERLPAITAHELLIFSHRSLSFVFQVCAAFEVASILAGFRRSLTILAGRSTAKSVELIDWLPLLRRQMNSLLTWPDRHFKSAAASRKG